jgi:hypothetical protein
LKKKKKKEKKEKKFTINHHNCLQYGWMLRILYFQILEITKFG